MHNGLVIRTLVEDAKSRGDRKVGVQHDLQEDRLFYISCYLLFRSIRISPGGDVVFPLQSLVGILHPFLLK